MGHLLGYAAQNPGLTPQNVAAHGALGPTEEACGSCRIRLLCWFCDPCEQVGDTGIMVKTEQIQVRTHGNCHVVDITREVAAAVAGSGLDAGVVTVFHVGSTAGVTTTEYEPGLANHDLKAAFERIAPEAGHYEHENTWQDDNGHSHVRASLLGPSLAVPFVEGQLTLGTWQQIILVDFDTRARTRTIICQIIGE
jgi:secondary thiamine-phosphate synthase enzyme